MDGAVEIAADRVEWSEGVAAAEGGIVVTFGDEVLVGERATWDGTTLVVERGEYRRPDGVFVFDRAEVRPRESAAVVVEARAETGGAAIAAERVTLGETWSAEGARVVPCPCADGGPPALTFSAARIEVVPERVVIIHGGLARVFDVPVLPVPYWRVPLDPRRFRVLLPEVGWGEYGTSAKVAGRFGVGDWFVEAGPAWRQDAGFRGEVEVTGPGVRGEGALGWDTEVGALRGAAATRGGFDGVARVGWDATWISDAAYLDDYAVDYVTRGVAWRESRLVANALGGALAADAWLPDDGSVGSLVRLRGGPRFAVGGVDVRPRLGVEVVGGLGGALTPVAEAGAGFTTTRTLPWLQVEARGDLAGRAAFVDGGLSATIPGVTSDNWFTTASDADPGFVGGALLTVDPWGEGFAAGPLARWGAGGSGVSAHAAMSAAVPVWSTLGPARLQWWPGVRAEARGAWLADGTQADAARAGPAARVSTGWSAGTVGLDAAVLHDGATWRPAAALDVATERVSARLRYAPDVQVGEVRWSPGALTLTGGAAHADGLAGSPDDGVPATLWLGWADASVRWRRLRVGGGAAWDLGRGAFSGADARLGYDDGCAAVGVSARFSPDRPLPDLGLSATLRR